MHQRAILAALSVVVLPVALSVAQDGERRAEDLIPEPLLYDMALPLGTPKGQVEINSIFRFPTGEGPVLSVPEIEGAVLDRLSFELEIEFEDERQTGWSAAGQFTLGRGLGQRFIHGLQAIVEREDDKLETGVLGLYIPAWRFSRVWSTLLMAGGRVPVQGDDSSEFVGNGSVFAEVTERATLAVELNYRLDNRRTEELKVIPQIHGVFSEHLAAQVGVGFWDADGSVKSEAMLRAICAF